MHTHTDPRRAYAAPLVTGALFLTAAFLLAACTGGGAPMRDGSSPPPAASGQSGQQAPPSRRQRVPLYSERFNAESPFDPAAGVRIAANNGPVEIVPGAGDTLRVHATVSAASPSRLEHTRVRLEPDAEGVLRVGVDWPSGREPAEASAFRIEAPVGARVTDVDAGNAAVRIVDMAGDVRIITTRGDVEVLNHRGHIHAETTYARVTVRDPGGNVYAKSENGVITVHNAPGRVRAVTANAGVDVRLSSHNPGPVHIESSLGAIHLEIGEGFVGELDLHSVSGSLDIPAALSEHIVSRGRERATLRFGEGGERSTVRTTGAAIRVRPTGTR
ncbi:MAG: hypothetical protein EA379_03950 [Phycisphaerales bacterium]|nr:MAG: hypothetical protein EA379_03950 [Phycisphaerales bacterium]